MAAFETLGTALAAGIFVATIASGVAALVRRLRGDPAARERELIRKKLASAARARSYDIIRHLTPRPVDPAGLKQEMQRRLARHPSGTDTGLAADLADFIDNAARSLNEQVHLSVRDVVGRLEESRASGSGELEEVLAKHLARFDRQNRFSSFIQNVFWFMMGSAFSFFTPEVRNLLGLP